MSAFLTAKRGPLKGVALVNCGDHYVKRERYDEEGRPYDDEWATGKVWVHPVGDHTMKLLMDWEDVRRVAEGEFCHSCGQLQCNHGKDA